MQTSYNQLTAKDAIVGVYPMLPGVEKVLATLSPGRIPSSRRTSMCGTWRFRLWMAWS